MLSRCVSGMMTAIAVVMLAPGGANAQSNYPNHTVKFVIPTPPGPTLDSLPRLIAGHLSDRWKVHVIVENIPGAAQNLRAEAVAKAAPDGYTILAAPKGPLAISQYEFSKLAFDPAAFVPVSIFATQPTVLVASAKAPFSTLRGMIEFAKANPGRINYGSPGAGSSLQLMVELLNKEAGIQTVHVPYKGLAPAEADLLAGHIDMMFDNLGNALPYIRSGQFKALAVSGKSPAAELPDFPAIAETFSDFVFTEWFAFVAPPKTDPAIAGSVAQGIAATLSLPDVAQRFRDVSVTPVGSTPTQAAALIQDESARWRKIVAQLGVKID